MTSKPLGSKRSAWRASLLLLATVLFAIAPLAHASPPDQTWQPGVYDDADFDDVILLVTAGITGLLRVFTAWPVLWAVRPMSAPAAVDVPVLWPAPTLQGRAPPGPAAVL